MLINNRKRELIGTYYKAGVPLPTDTQLNRIIEAELEIKAAKLDSKGSRHRLISIGTGVQTAFEVPPKPKRKSNLQVILVRPNGIPRSLEYTLESAPYSYVKLSGDYIPALSDLIIVEWVV